MRRKTIAAWRVVAAGLCGAATLGCDFNTDGGSGTAALGPTMGNADTGDTEDTAPPPSTTRGSGGLTTGPSGGTADAGSSESGEVMLTTGPTDADAAFLTLSETQVNFATAQSTDSVGIELVVTNEGMQAAKSMRLATLDATFHMVGGYPGTDLDGRCGGSLDPGESCILVITNSPTIIGLSIGRFSLSYFDGVVNRATSEIPVRAAVEGSTENLLENPSGATGSANPWEKSATEGDWVADADASSPDDSFSFRPGGNSIVIRTLHQQVPLDAFATANTNARLSYHVSVYARRTDNGDDYTAKVQIAGGEWTNIGGGTDTSWQLLESSGQLPGGVVPSIGLEFQCSTAWEGFPGGFCGARFDRASITLSYP